MVCGVRVAVVGINRCCNFLAEDAMRDRCRWVKRIRPIPVLRDSSDEGEPPLGLWQAFRTSGISRGLLAESTKKAGDNVQPALSSTRPTLLQQKHLLVLNECP
jgi:hypothetical protein